MGKNYQTEQQVEEQIPAKNQAQTGSSSPDQSNHIFGGCSNGLVRIKNSVSLKCIIVFLVIVALFLSAIFWVPPFNRLTSNGDANATDQLNDGFGGYKSSWPELVGTKAEYATKVIEKENPNLCVVIVPDGNDVLAVIVSGRVLLWLDGNGIVVAEPRLG